MNLHRAPGLALLLAVMLGGCTGQEQDWQTSMLDQRPRLGHRNWIVIADAAYPWQTAPGIQTIVTDASQVQVVRAVLDAVEAAPHVDPIIHVDEELEFVSEADAPGIGGYRHELDKLLGNRPVTRLGHEQIIAKLDEAGGTFHVLLLKTDMTLPYTSVFIELYAGYWDADREAQLRELIKNGLSQ